MSDIWADREEDVDKLLGQLSVTLDDIVSLVNQGDFLIGEASRLLKKSRLANDEKPSLLLVDDEELVLKALARSLGKEFEITKAQTVEEAIELLGRVSFDAVISDFHLIEGNGIDVLRIALREQPTC
jgi:PleD family two-component response regulator